MSASIAAGTTNEVNYLLKQFPQLGTNDSKALGNWATAAANNDDEADKPYGQVEVGKEWRAYHDKCWGNVVQWLERNCNQCKDIVGDDNSGNLRVVLSGGALMNEKLAALFRETIKNYLPNSKIDEKSYTDDR